MSGPFAFFLSSFYNSFFFSFFGYFNVLHFIWILGVKNHILKKLYKFCLAAVFCFYILQYCILIIWCDFTSDNKRLDEWVEEDRLDTRKIQYPRRDLASAATTGLNTPKKTLTGTTNSRPSSPGLTPVRISIQYILGMHVGFIGYNVAFFCILYLIAMVLDLLL